VSPRNEYQEAIVARVLAAPIGPPPPPWRELDVIATGGLTEVGFARGSDLLLVCSHVGRGVFDGLTGERLARDRSEAFDADLAELEAEGIGPLAGQRIRMAGLHGGGLAASTPDGWSVERLTLDWPDDELLLVPPGGSIYPPRPVFHRLEGAGVTSLRAFGFSPTGRTLVIATSSELVLASRG
jgi:hypothetical protein